MGLIYITWGRKLFGRVERVPGFFYVATEFFHIWYCPLIPLRTVVVANENENGWQGHKIRLSAKSILLAWILPLSLLVWTLGGTIACVIWTDRNFDVQGKIIAGTVVIGAFLLWLLLLILPRRLRPNHTRAIELANAIGLDASRLAALNSDYQL